MRTKIYEKSVSEEITKELMVVSNRYSLTVKRIITKIKNISSVVGVKLTIRVRRGLSETNIPVVRETV